MSGTRLKAALSYAKIGWYVVPDHSVLDSGKCTCSDSTCTTPGKHPRIERGTQNEYLRRTGSRDPRQIEEWWNVWPDSNVAIVCGRASSLIVVDVDPRNGGFESLARLQLSRGVWPITKKVSSGGGGFHIYFKHPGTEVVRNRIGLYRGIDIKADGGRIVAPPSKHPSGKRYSWIHEDCAVASMPSFLYEAIQTHKGTGTRSAIKKRELIFGHS